MAACVAGLVAAPATEAFGYSHPRSAAEFGEPLVLGALFIAIGAILNDACLLGSLWRLGNGEIRLLLLPVGLAVGFALAPQVLSLNPDAHVLPGLAADEQSQLPWRLSFLFVLAASVLTFRWFAKRGGAKVYGVLFNMVLLGLLGGCLFVAQPGWTYADITRVLASMASIQLPLTSVHAAPAAATVAGATFAAWRSGLFHLRWPAWLDALRTVLGGAVMATGAVLVPGGNDALLLSSIPSGSLPAVLAYALIAIFVFSGLLLARLAGISTAIKRHVPANSAGVETSQA